MIMPKPKKVSLEVCVYENGTHICESNGGHIFGNISTKMLQRLFNKEAQKWLDDNDWIKQTNRFTQAKRWIHKSHLKGTK